MEEIYKELKQALEKLEKCCPGSTRVSHMSTASTELHKALLKLEQARSQEQRLREESDSLLDVVNIIKGSENNQEAFKKVFEVLKRLIKFDDAFILKERTDGSLSTVASSSPQFENIIWYPGQMMKHVLLGRTTNIQNINYSADWLELSSDIRRKVVSSLHITLNTALENAMLICTSSQENYFKKSHIQLLERLAPLASQALYFLIIKELLNDEIKKRKQAEERLEEALIEIKNTKV